MIGQGLGELTVMPMARCHQGRYRAVPAYRTPYDSVKKCLIETAHLGYYRPANASLAGTYRYIRETSAG